MSAPATYNKGKLLNDLSKLTQGNTNEDLKKFFIGLVGVALTCAVFYVASNDPKALNDNFYLYCVFGILPTVVGIAIASRIFSGPIDINGFYFYAGVLFLFIVSMYLFYRTMNPSSVLYTSYVLNIFIVIAIIVGLAIIYRIFVRTILNTRGWLGFFLKFLFLIPCLLIELIETVFAELKVAPKMIVALFILEIVIILVYIYFPRITKRYSDSIILLERPEFLSKITLIGNANKLFMDVNERDNPEKSETMIRQNFAVSMWFYVNQHPKSHAAYSKETNIFRYGYPSSKIGHPKVTYYNDTTDTNKSDKYVVYINDGNEVLLDIPTQSWNQLVISYNKSVVDIFLNGSLEKSVPLTDRPNYDTGDVIEVGEGDNTVTRGGLHGAICNVVYHKHPVTPFQVAGDYNLNRYNNPPSIQWPNQ